MKSRILDLKIKSLCILKNPVHAFKYIILKDKSAELKLREAYEEIYRKEAVQHVLRVLFGLSMNTVKKLVEEVYNERKIWDTLNHAILSYERTDPSRMRFYKGPMLYVVVRALRPEVVVETGVASGVSTLFILTALEKNGKGLLYSIDLPNVEEGSSIPPGLSPGWIVPPNLRKRWKLLLGDSKQILPKLLKELGSIDMFLHDSLHTYEHMMFEYKTAYGYIREGGIIASDDAYIDNVFHEFCKTLTGKARIKYSIHRGFALMRIISKSKEDNKPN